MWKEVSGWECLPSTILAVTIRSRKEELTEEPTMAWSTLVPATSRTVLTFPGEVGQAMSGSTFERSISSYSSYSAPSSAESSRQASPRPWASRYSRVRSSEGKTEVVAPSSVPMLPIVSRSVAERVFTPGP